MDRKGFALLRHLNGFAIARLKTNARFYLFTVCPGILVLAELAKFVRRAMELGSKYEVIEEPGEEQDQVNSHAEHPAR